MERLGYKDLEEMLKDLNRRMEKVKRATARDAESSYMDYDARALNEGSIYDEMCHRAYRELTKRRTIDSKKYIISAKNLLNEYFGALDIFLRLPIGDAFKEKSHYRITDIEIIYETIQYLEKTKRDCRTIKTGDKEYAIDLNRLKKSSMDFEKGIEVLTLIRDIFTILNKIHIDYISMYDEKILWDKVRIKYFLDKMKDLAVLQKNKWRISQVAVIEKKFYKLSKVLDNVIIETDSLKEIFFDGTYLPNCHILIKSIECVQLKHRTNSEILSFKIYDDDNICENPFLLLVDKREADSENKQNNLMEYRNFKLGDIKNLKIQTPSTNSITAGNHTHDESTYKDDGNLTLDIVKANEGLVVGDKKTNEMYFLNKMDLLGIECYSCNTHSITPTSIQVFRKLQEEGFKESLLRYYMALNKMAFVLHSYSKDHNDLIKKLKDNNIEPRIEGPFFDNIYEYTFTISIDDFDLDMFFKHKFLKFNLEK